jgi:hypothetical protein
MARLNASDKKTALETKRAQIEAQLKALNAREKETARKEDTRRKVIAGAIALEHFEKHATGAWAAEFSDLLAKFVEPRSRHLFPFLTEKATPAKGKNGAAASPPSKESEGAKA